MVCLLFLLIFLFVKQIVYPDEEEKGKEIKTVFGDDVAHWPYEPLPLMTNSEVRFFELLRDAVPEYFIFAQVQLSRIIDANQAPESRKWLNRISRLSIDYLLVDVDAQTSLIAIELDDWSHESEARQRTDAKKNKALSCAGIPIMRFHVEKMPTVEQLRREILAVMEAVYE